MRRKYYSALSAGTLAGGEEGIFAGASDSGEAFLGADGVVAVAFGLATPETPLCLACPSDATFVAGAAATGAEVALVVSDPASGTADDGATGADTGCRASEASSVAGARLNVARPARPIDRSTKRLARIVVARVRKSAAPRAVIKPDGLPPPASPPPSERCIRMTPTMAAAMIA